MQKARNANSPDNLKLKVGGKYRDRHGNEVMIESEEGLRYAPEVASMDFRFKGSNNNYYNIFGWCSCSFDPEGYGAIESTLGMGLIEEVKDSKEDSEMYPKDFVVGLIQRIQSQRIQRVHQDDASVVLQRAFEEYTFKQDPEYNEYLRLKQKFSDLE